MVGVLQHPWWEWPGHQRRRLRRIAGLDRGRSSQDLLLKPGAERGEGGGRGGGEEGEVEGREGGEEEGGEREERGRGGRGWGVR